jgi:hypothetical protein
MDCYLGCSMEMIATNDVNENGLPWGTIKMAAGFPKALTYPCKYIQNL